MEFEYCRKMLLLLILMWSLISQRFTIGIRGQDARSPSFASYYDVASSPYNANIVNITSPQGVQRQTSTTMNLYLSDSRSTDDMSTGKRSLTENNSKDTDTDEDGRNKDEEARVDNKQTQHHEEDFTLPHQQLIYKFAIEYKQIPRVTLLTCNPTTTENPSMGPWQKHNEHDKRMSSLASGKASLSTGTIDTIAILRMFSRGASGQRNNNNHYNDGTELLSNRTEVLVGSSRNVSGSVPRPSAKRTNDILIKILQIGQLINNRVNRGVSNNSASVATRLEMLLRSETLRQIVVLDLSCGQASRKVIEMASNKGLFNSSYHWLLIEDYPFNRQGAVINAVHIHDASMGENVARTAAANAWQDNKIDAPFDDKHRENDTNNNCCTTSNDELIETFLEKINININTELILAKRTKGTNSIAISTSRTTATATGTTNDDLPGHQRKDFSYMLYDVWNPGLQNGGQLNISEIGNFSQDGGLQIAHWYKSSTTITRRMDMRNASIRCMIVITNKNLTDNLEHYLTTQYDVHLDSMHRFNFALLSYARDLFNFSFVLSRTTSWGYPKDGKFDGMIGALVQHQVDIGGSPIFFRIERAKVIDYTVSTWVARPCFIFRHPRTTHTDRIVFLQPFTNDVWMLIAICGSLTVGLLWILMNMERGLNSYDNADRKCGERNKNIQPQISTDKAKLIGMGDYFRQNSSQNTSIKRQMAQQTMASTKPARPPAEDIAGGIDGQEDNDSCRKTLPSQGIFEDVISRILGNTRRRRTKSSVVKTLVDSRLMPRSMERSSSAGVHRKWPPRRKMDNNDDDGIGFNGPIDVENFAGTSTLQPDDLVRKNDGRSTLTLWWPKTTRNMKAFVCDFFRTRFVRWENYGNNSVNRQGFALFQESVVFFIGAVCQQGISFPTNFLSGRCIVLISLLFSFAIYQFYSASIVGKLLLEKPKTIKTVRDITYSSLDIGIEDIAYNRDFFLRTKDPDALELYAKKIGTAPAYDDQTFRDIQPDAVDKPTMTSDMYRAHQGKIPYAKTSDSSSWYDVEFGTLKVKKGGFAFYVDVAVAYKIILDNFDEREICDLTEIQLFAPQMMVNIVQKGSPLRKIITYGLRRAAESGLMDYQRKVWHSPKPRCVKKIHADDLRVEMQTFTSAVFVLIFGFVASMMTLALEFMHNNLWQRFAT